MPASSQKGERQKGGRFVDRIEEVAALEKSLNMAEIGKGNMVLIRGEAGIGKSRLVSEIAGIAESRGFHILRGSCLEYRRAPYQPFREMLMDHFKTDLSRPYYENLGRISASIDEDFPNVRENKALLVEFFYPMDEPLGGYKVAVHDLGATIETMRKKGFRTIYLGDIERLRSRMVQTDGLENLPIGDGPHCLNPRRIEKLARIIKDTFKSFSHSAIIIGDMAPLLDCHDPSRIGKFIQISNALSVQNGGVMIYVDDVEGYQVLDDIRPLSEHLSKEHRPLARNEAEGRPALSIVDLITRLFKDLSSRAPQLTIVEDLQWGDTPTFNLLQYMARNIADQRHLILGTFRDESLTSEQSSASMPLKEALQRFTREHLFEEIHLGPIDDVSIMRIVEDLLGKRPPREFAEEVMRDCEGNPLFVHELMKLRSDPSVNLPSGIEGSPQSAATLVRRRIETLEPKERTVLEQASVLDKHASLELLSKTLSLSVEDLLDPVDHLISLKFFREKDENITFEHSKVRELVYDLIEPDRRSFMHLSAARCLESSLQADSPSYLSVLSHHYLRGGDPKKALELMLQMTEGARGLLAAEGVVELMASGAESLGGSPGDKGAAEFKARVYMRLGDLLESLEDLDGSMAHYQKAVDLCETEGLQAFLPPAYRRLGDLMLRSYRWDHATDYYLRALHLAKRGDATVEIAQVFRGLGRMYHLKGDYPRAIECYLKYLEVPSHSKGRPYFLGMVGLGDVYKDLGDFNQALVYYKVAVKTSEEYGLPSDIPLAYIRMARVLLHFNEMSDSERMCEWAYTLAKELNRPHLTREVTIHFAETMLDLGIIKRAEESLQEFSDQGGPMEDRLLEAIFNRVSGILYSRIRDNDRAARNLADSVSILEDIQIPYELGRSYMEQGLFRFQNMDIEGAIASLQRSNGIFKGLRSVHYLNRTSGKLRELKFLSEGMK